MKVFGLVNQYNYTKKILHRFIETCIILSQLPSSPVNPDSKPTVFESVSNQKLYQAVASWVFDVRYYICGKEQSLFCY